MGDQGFGQQSIQQWVDQANNPAAPSGLSQTAQAGMGYAQGDPRFAQSSLARWTVESDSYADNAQSWFTGANREGEANGWATPFWNKAVDSYNAAAEAGQLGAQFENKEYATGVVTYGHQSADKTKTFRFGDVYEDGEWKGNLYDQFDEKTADLMMSQMMFEGDKLQRTLTGPDPLGSLHDQIASERLRRETEAPKAAQAQAFAADSAERAALFDESGVDMKLVAGGTIGGAATGAATGAALTAWLGPGAGIGALVGGGIGGLVGGVGSYLNRDELTQQAARAYEITALAKREEGSDAALTTGLQQWAGVASQLSSPSTQLVHGLADSERGDLESGFYAVDPRTGKSEVGLGWKVAGLTAAVADGTMQFIHPASRAIYMAETGGQIVGEAGTLGTTQGKLFDPREGGFDNIFVDDQGNPDPVSASAGILKIGIDAVQLTGWGALSRSIGRNRAAIVAGERPLEYGGMRFTRDAEGNVSRRFGLSILAPSEQVAWANTSRLARVNAAKEGRAVSADDLYAASMQLAAGDHKLRTAWVNAFGEGYEEFTQELLDPVAFDGRIDVRSAIDSFFYGAAGGLGMSLGATFSKASPEQQIENMARLNYRETFGTDMPAGYYEELSDSERKRLASPTLLDSGSIGSALQQWHRDFSADLVASSTDAAAAFDARATVLERERKRATTATDDYTVITGRSKVGDVSSTGELLRGTMRAEALVMSAATVGRVVDNQMRGLLAQDKFLAARLETLNADDTADPQLKAETEDLATRVSTALEVGFRVGAEIMRRVEEIYADDTVADDVPAMVEALNDYMRLAFEGKVAYDIPDIDRAETALAAARFMSILYSREPKVHTGSYHSMLPQASVRHTLDRADNFYELNQDFLSAIGGDFDGDKLRAENQLILSEDRWRDSRSGANLAGVGRKINIAVRNYDAAEAEAVGSALRGSDPDLADMAESTMTAIETAIRTRYGSLMSPDRMDAVLQTFRDHVSAGLDPVGDVTTEGARVGLINALATEAGERINAIGRDRLNNEWLWISQVVRSNFQRFQRSWVERRDQLSAGPTVDVDTTDVLTDKGTNVRKSRAVTTAQTLSLFSTGDNLFRAFQHIHFSAYNLSVLSAANVDQADLTEIAAFYAELARDITTSELDRVQVDDSIAARGLAMLSRLVDSALADPEMKGLDPSTAMLVFANTKVRDVYTLKGEIHTDDVSLAQVILRKALEAERQEFARTWNENIALQLKHKKLMAYTKPGDVNAARAAFELFKHIPFSHSLGIDTGTLAPMTTPEQWLATYRTKDSDGRAAESRLLKNVAPYLSRKKKQSLPYTLSEAATRSVSVYRSMVDMLLAVGNNELTFDPQIKRNDWRSAFKGEVAKQNFAAQDAFLESWRLVRQALGSYRAVLEGTGPMRSNTELVQEMFNLDPSAGRLLHDTLPPDIRNALFEEIDGTLHIDAWFYDVFAIEDAEEALAKFVTRSKMTSWASTLVSVHEDDGESNGRVYDRLKSRFDRMMYNLAQEPGQPRLGLLMEKMATAKNVDELFYWINTTPGILPLGSAPLLPFADDAALFEPDVRTGWTSASLSSDQRAAITAFKRGAKSLRDTMRMREERRATDTVRRNNIEDALARGDDNDPDLIAFRRLLSTARRIPRGLGASLMQQVTTGALEGFGAGSHNKGVTADWVGPFGEFQALMDAFGFLPGMERVLEDLTAHSVESLRISLGDVMRRAGLAMDSDGREISWVPPNETEMLQMLKDPRTEPLALALLTPSAFDVSMASGGLVERPLFDPSLGTLLDGSDFSDLFKRDSNGHLSPQRAYTYLTLIDAGARAEGDDFSLVRYANDLVITRASALRRELRDNPGLRAKMVDEAYIEIAETLQTAGHLEFVPATRDSRVLSQLKDWGKERLKQKFRSRALPGFTDTDAVFGPRGDVVEKLVDQALQARENQFLDDLAELDAEQGLSPETYLGRRTALENKLAADDALIVRLLSDDRTGEIAAAFTLTGDAVEDQSKKREIAEYVTSIASFPARAAAAEQAFTTVVEVMSTGEDVAFSKRVTPAMWDALSRAAIGVRLADETYPQAVHVALQPLPAGDPTVSSSKFYKYFDRTYGYLTDILEPTSQTVKMAVMLHGLGNQSPLPLEVEAARSVLTRGVLDGNRLGTWTDGQVAQIIEAHQRMDSSGAPGAIAAAGNGPKRWAAVMAATRATSNPADVMDKVSTLKLPLADLLDESAEFLEKHTLTVAGATRPQTMPVRQLDNRFFLSIRVNGEDVPLDYGNMGFTWNLAETQLPLRYISLERMRPALERWATDKGLDLATASVELDFIHPDSQPEGAAWMNSSWFEGKSHTLLPDSSESLIAALFSDTNSEIAAATEGPLKTVKKGKRALLPYVPPSPDALTDIEIEWATTGDLAAMLRAKTKLVLTTHQGGDKISTEHYNALYKMLKLHHVFVGEGLPTLTAEAYIARRAAGADPLTEGYRLKILSPDVLRTILGDTGDQGVPRWFGQEYLLHPELVSPYTGLGDNAAPFMAGWLAEPGSIGDTMLVDVGAQRRLKVRPARAFDELNLMAERVNMLNAKRAKAHDARQKRMKLEDIKEQFTKHIDAAKKAIATERHDFDWSVIRQGLINPTSEEDADHSIRILQRLLGDAFTGLERAFVVQDSGDSVPVNGVLNVQQLLGKRDEQHSIVRGDVVLIKLDTFEQRELDGGSAEETLKKLDRVITYLTNAGAYVVLGSGTARRDLRWDASTMLEQHGYESSVGSAHIFEPVETSARTQNERAYESTLRETRLITPAWNAVTFLAVDPIGTDENMAYLSEDSRKLFTRRVLNNLIPSIQYRGYGIIEDDKRDFGGYKRATDKLLEVLDPTNSQAREKFREMAGPKKIEGVLTIDEALDRLYEKVSVKGTARPQEGDVLQLGDIIPLVDYRGRMVFYRHGLSSPRNDTLDQVQQDSGMLIAVAETKRDSVMTANNGYIEAVDMRAGYGRQLTLRSELQPSGDKIVLEFSGMKYVVTRAPDGKWLPPAKLGPNGLVVDLWSDVQSADSKQAFTGRVNNYRNALAFFGFDFWTDLTEFFFPGSSQDPAARTVTYNLLLEIQRHKDLKVPLRVANDLVKMRSSVAALLAEADLTQAGNLDAGWIDRITNPTTVTDEIAQAMIIYLMTPGANLHNVLQASGFFHSEAGSEAIKSREVPGIFAGLLDHGTSSALHGEFVRRWNARLQSSPDGSGFRIHRSWLVEAWGSRPRRRARRRRVIRGYLQYSEAHPTGDNPVTNAQASDMSGKAAVSTHNALAAFGSLGAITVAKPMKAAADFVRSFRRDQGLPKFTGPDADSMWEMISRVPREDGSLNGWRRLTGGEVARMMMARQEISGLFQPIDTRDENLWQPGEETRYRSLVTKILQHVGLDGMQGQIVDTWVRQHLGAPLEGEHGKLNGRESIETAEDIWKIVQQDRLPTAEAFIPLMDINILTTMFMANVNRRNGWAPNGVDRSADTETQWEQWVAAAFGEAFEGGPTYRPYFHPVFLLAVDGLTHGYIRATSQTRNLPVTSDMLRQAQLLDPETGRLMLSINPETRQLIEDPALLDSARMQLDDIVAGQRIYSMQRREFDPESAKGRRKQKIERWAKAADMPEPQRHTIRGERQKGQSFLDNTTKTSVIWRVFLNMRAAQTLLNPLLIVSAPVEAFIRRNVDMIAGSLTGESMGMVTGIHTRLTDKISDTTLGAVQQQLGVDAPMTHDELQQLRALSAAMSERSDFKSMVYKELFHQYPVVPGMGRVEHFFERLAKFGARMQDPSLGMMPRDLSTKYLEAVVRNMHRNPLGDKQYSLQTLIAGLSMDSGWVEKNDREAHNMALASIANMRSVKGTVLSLATRGILEPMSESKRGWAVNGLGNFARMLTMFQNFWTTWTVNVMGLQGAADFVAFMVDGRQKKLGLRLQNAVRGDAQPDFRADDPEYYDMSPILESIDLADAFIRGGVTHTGLFVFGLAAQGLGLTGDDDEAKWRRRAAELQGGGFINDPKKLMEDFRNRDAIYLNFLPPFLSDALGFTVTDADGNRQQIAGMNWLARTFLSPVLGMERFYNSGDFTEVIHGFGDAIGSHPIMNQQLVAATMDTVNTLHMQADEAAGQDTPEGYGQSVSLLTTAVGVMERMLFENAFINMLYVNLDRYDRDPYKLVRTDSDGNPQVDVMGNPNPSAQLKDFLDEDGNIMQAYIQRDPAGATYRALSENRATLALLGSLFTGFSGDGFASSDMIRYNMVPKVRSVELAPQSDKTIESYLLAAFYARNATMEGDVRRGGQRALSVQDARNLVIADYKDRGEWYEPDQVEREARAMSRASGPALLSYVNQAGQEVPTTDGAEAIFNGLKTGALEFSSESLQGVFITKEQRLAIQERWMHRLVAEGVAMGMDRYAAESRMKRLWFGPYGSDGSTGLGSLLATDQIPLNGKLEYNQLNTTYVMGPNGFPMAVGFTRGGLLGSLGLRWFNRPWNTGDTGLGMDSRMNTVDTVAGINTGLRALEKRGEGWEIKSMEEELRDAADRIVKAIEDMPTNDIFDKAKSDSGGGYYYGHGYGSGYHGGGGGGYYSGGSSYFVRMYALPENISVYGNSIPFINTSNPILRRADVRRERVWSERGRLKQWQ